MPSPTADIVSSIVERLKGACTNGTREPTAVLSADEHNALLDLHIHDPMAAGVCLQHVREHARGLENWNERQVNRISFRLYRDGATRYHREQASIESGANIVRMNAQRNARLRRARTHDVSGESLAGLSVAQMLETEAPMLIAFALLKQHREGRIWYDEFYKRTLTDWRGDEQGTVIEAQPLYDEHVMRVQRWLHAADKRLSKLSVQTVNQLLDAIANEDKRNEPREWIFGTTWDGAARLVDVMRVGFGAPDSEFNREAGRCWFVSMVARIFVPGCKVDTMPVFIGSQGVKKSQALEVIGGKWYRTAASNIDSKDFLQELHGALVFEIQELHSILASRHGEARTKAVLSTRVDNFRLPYGMRVEEHKRTAVICGTTNKRDWHSDETGGRRYWPVHCGVIHLPWLRRHRAQLFAEAWTYWQNRRGALATLESQPRDSEEEFVEPDDDVYRLGQWWNVPEAQQIELMDAETFVHPWHERIETRLTVELRRAVFYTGQDDERPTPWDGTASDSTEWGNTLTVTRIGVQWLGLTSDAFGRGSAAGKTIAGVMRALGWELKQMRIPGRAERIRAFVPSHDWLARHIEGESGLSHHVDNVTSDNRIDDEDIPF